MERLLYLSFWFNLRPPQLTTVAEYILIGFLVLLAGATIVSFFKKNQKGKSKNFYIMVWRRLYYFSLTNLILGLILLFFNYETIPFFSSRFWYVIWGIVMGMWLASIYKLFKTIPQKIKQAEQEESFKKYIP